MAIYEFKGKRPRIDATAYIHPQATLIGEVIVGPGCYVGPHASLRGDFGLILLEEGSNVQDNCTLHVGPGETCRLGPRSHVGHGAGGQGLEILGAADLAAAFRRAAPRKARPLGGQRSTRSGKRGGSRNHARVVAHVLRLEGRDLQAPAGIPAAQRGRQPALAGAAGGAQHHHAAGGHGRTGKRCMGPAFSHPAAARLRSCTEQRG